jgi:hypothetical protein
MIHKGEKFKGNEVCPELEMLVQQLFAVMPNLEFYATNAANLGSIGDARKINVFDVFSGDQKLGVVSWYESYSRSKGHYFSYRIYSRKIRKERGDAHLKMTGSLKSALKIAGEVFVKDAPNVLAEKFYEAMRSEMSGLIYHASNDIEHRCRPFFQTAFAYTVSVIQGSPVPIDAKLLQEVTSPRFEEAQNTCRIAKSVGNALSSREGVIVYVDREEKLTVVDLQTYTISKLESTYDLPKNYQEKFTILKVMEDNQPIEGTGIKMKVSVDDMKLHLFYLVSGNVIVTH